MIDDRKFMRFKTYDGSFVVPRPQANSTKLAKLIDISNGGLAFQYFMNNDIDYDYFTELDVYISGDGKILEQIPIQMISTIIIPLGDPYFSITSIKRLSVKFGKMSSTKIILLKKFIDEYTLKF